VERRATLALAGIMALRMLGLFMILPVFALYAQDLEYSTETLIGVAMGIYGLTQGLLQIPFGMVSDRLGRKPVIIFGLLLFAAGSVLAALSTSIYGVIAGRALQGAGAVSAAVMALAADLTREEHRTKAMAILGMSIGSSFLIALLLGPVLGRWIGVAGIFWLTAALALGAIAVLHLAVPRPRHSHFHRDAEAAPEQLKKMLRHPELLRLDFGVMVLHAQITALFVVLPVALKQNAGLDSAHHWYVYLPVLLLSVGLMLPFMIIAEKRRKLKPIFAGAVALLALAQAGLGLWHDSLIGIFIMLTLFFAAFNFLEANQPSLISRAAPLDGKGTALGIYSTLQFFGIFIGGVAGGWLHHHFGMGAVFGLCAGLSLLWLGLALTMPPPRYLSSHMINLGSLDKSRASDICSRLKQIPGVAEAVVLAEDGVAYLKVDKTLLDMAALEPFSAPEEA
jgi:MFS family permease